jgi:hypothetical protein
VSKQPQNDERVRKGGTYHDFATSDASAVGGRFSAEGRQRVVGSASFEYPALPANSPWHDDLVPNEGPTDIDVSVAPVVGEFHEVAASLAGEGIKDSSSPPGDLPSGDGRSAAGPHPAASSAPSPPSTKQQSRKRIRS